MAEETISYDGDGSNDNVVTNIAVVRGAPKGIIEWMLQRGWVKSADQATKILFGVAILFFMASIFILVSSSGGFSAGKPQPIPPAIPDAGTVAN